MTAPLETLDIETAARPAASVVFMHGLGADMHDFEPVAPEIARLSGLALRFVLPNAPVRPVTANAGHPMRAWFDITTLAGETLRFDEADIRASAAAIRALIRRENDHGFPTSRIVLGGFSQGGAMAVYAGLRHRGRLAGIVGLSAFPLLESTLDAERTAANRSTPVFLGHGTRDLLVDVRHGEALARALESRGQPVEWHAYPIEHGVSPEELGDLADWLGRTLG